MTKSVFCQKVRLFFVLILIHSCISNNQEIARDKNGNIILKCELKNGVRHGNCYQYYPNGAILVIGKWIEGVREGESITYFENGNIQSTSMWKDDKLDGEYFEYFENGGVKETIYYIKGQPRRHEYYDENSRLQKVYDFIIINNKSQLNGHVVYDTNNASNYPYNINFQKTMHAQIFADRDTIDYGNFAEYEVQWICSNEHYVSAVTGNIDHHFNVVDSASLKEVDLRNINRFYPSHLKTDTLRILFQFLKNEDGKIIIIETCLEEIFTVIENIETPR